MKKTLLVLFIAVTVFSCKKSNTTPQLDISGKWVASSVSINNQVATVAEYPCIAHASLIFGSGNNATVGWDGDAPCEINQEGNLTFGGVDGWVLTFTRKGNDLFFPPGSAVASIGHATIESVNGKLQLTMRDTATIHYEGSTSITYNANIYIKQ